MNIIVAIPNYNGSKTLPNLITQLLKENFSRIYVIDDASTDDSVEIIRKYPVNIIKNKINMGPAAARNRILEEHVEEDIILFMDADMSIVSSNIKDNLRKVFESRSDVGIVGGMILDDNVPMRANYSFKTSFCYRKYGDGDVRRKAAIRNNPYSSRLFLRNKERAEEFQKELFSIERYVDYTAEGCFSVRSSLFKSLEGFDSNFRYFHEGGDFSKRARKMGYKTFFTPNIVVNHHKQASIGKKRKKKLMYLSYLRWFYKWHEFV